MDNELRSCLISLPFIKTIKDISDELDTKVYIAGGIVRDMIIRRLKGIDSATNPLKQFPGEVLDLDFIIKGDALLFGKKVGDAIGGSFFPLDEERSVSRVVVKKPEVRSQKLEVHEEIILDFSRIRGNSIEDDLRIRDFTVNSIALSLDNLFSNSGLELIDPSGGVDDIKKRIIKVYDKSALDDDPLRMLRAVRFESRLDFAMDGTLETFIKEGGYRLKSSAGERVRSELFNILSCKSSHRYIQKLKDLCLLKEIIYESEFMENLEQESHHRYLLWEHSLNTLKALEVLLENIRRIFPDRHPGIDELLSMLLEHKISYREVLKLSAILHDAGKPQVKIVDEQGEPGFINHEKFSAEIGENLCQRLKLGNNTCRIMSSIIRNHMRPIVLSRKRDITNREIFIFFRDTQKEGVLICLLSIADIHATRGSGIFDDIADDIEGLARRMLDFYFENFITQMNSPLITGNEIMEILGLQSGPEIGAILKEIGEYRAEGIITDKEDAIKFIITRNRTVTSSKPEN